MLYLFAVEVHSLRKKQQNEYRNRHGSQNADALQMQRRNKNAAFRMAVQNKRNQNKEGRDTRQVNSGERSNAG